MIDIMIIIVLIMHSDDGETDWQRCRQRVWSLASHTACHHDDEENDDDDGDDGDDNDDDDNDDADDNVDDMVMTMMRMLTHRDASLPSDWKLWRVEIGDATVHKILPYPSHLLTLR